MGFYGSFLSNPAPKLSRIAVDTDLDMEDWQVSGTYHKIVVQEIDPPEITSTQVSSFITTFCSGGPATYTSTGVFPITISFGTPIYCYDDSSIHYFENQQCSSGGGAPYQQNLRNVSDNSIVWGSGATSFHPDQVAVGTNRVWVEDNQYMYVYDGTGAMVGTHDMSGTGCFFNKAIIGMGGREVAGTDDFHGYNATISSGNATYLIYDFVATDSTVTLNSCHVITWSSMGLSGFVGSYAATGGGLIGNKMCAVINGTTTTSTYSRIFATDVSSWDTTVYCHIRPPTIKVFPSAPLPGTKLLNNDGTFMGTSGRTNIYRMNIP